MNKKIVLKVILLFVIILFVFFIVHTIRNFIIISNIQNKIMKYSGSDNYHIKIIVEDNDEIKTETDFYKKGNKEAAFLQRKKIDKNDKILMYNNNGIKHIYTQTEEGIALSTTSGFLSIFINNGVETENIWQKIFASIMADIKIISEDGKEYYQLKHIFLSNVISNDILLIDKQTGLIYKNISENLKIIKEYEFDNVDDLIFIEPDIN